MSIVHSNLQANATKIIMATHHFCVHPGTHHINVRSDFHNKLPFDGMTAGVDWITTETWLLRFDWHFVWHFWLKKQSRQSADTDWYFRAMRKLGWWWLYIYKSCSQKAWLSFFRLGKTFNTSENSLLLLCLPNPGCVRAVTQYQFDCLMFNFSKD